MNSVRVEPSPVRPSFNEALRVWWMIGLMSFGGPAGQIALMHRVLVEERKWVSEAQFLHALNFCMLLPGPEAQQLATYVGWLFHGVRGGLVAGTLFVLPGFVVIVALTTTYALFQDSAWLIALFFGLKAAVLAIVLEALIRIGKRALKTRFDLLVAGLAFVGIYALHVPFPAIILAAGIAGYVRAGLVGSPGPGQGEALLAVPEPAGGHWRRTGRILITGAALWAGPVIAVAAWFGPASIYPDLGIFFSKMAVVTFGGAYAVLAYVADAAVKGFGWLSAAEMLDGLAMAETTPGPLILVLTYVGYLAAFHAALGLPPVAAGLLGATLTTWVTFVPYFLWIFLGAPYIEKLRGNRHLAGALSAITAAVVGVILNLSLFLGLHVLFREVREVSFGPFHPAMPSLASVDPWAVALFAVAAVALLRLNLGMIPVLAISAGLGALVTYLT